MNIAITFRQMETTEAVKSYATEKVAKIQKFLRQPMKAQVTLSVQKTLHFAEVEVHSGSEHFHAHEQSEDMYASIDRVIDKLERQVRETKSAERSSRKGADRASQHLLPDVED
ncbi:MAG: ribosome-associated translation inhibitor RaiA [Myxococcales bacterium]|jgi:putative sigma-54 modulation protein|nr:ribosome-associated translation inhibitor RaiA [Myxococcales bacterium]MBL0193531.1 ribosome-associated translation inhibitor RaiA [Myxococcales bacterium]HQY64449.1 ribosome-associated translation inhibitor RaiA [Polyangiaceae bacterium]